MSMPCVHILAALALRRVLLHACQPVGCAGPAFTPTPVPIEDTSHLTRGLRQATGRAWVAVQVLLHGEGFWERAQLDWQRPLEIEFFQPVRAFLDGVELHPLHSTAGYSLRNTLATLEAALHNGLLTCGTLEANELLALPILIGSDEPSERGEEQVLQQLADELTNQDYGALGPLLALRWRMGPPLLVVLVAAFFCHVVEVDPDLFGEFASVCIDNLHDDALDELRGLAIVLDRHRARVDSILTAAQVATVAAPPARADNPAADCLARGIALNGRGDHAQAIAEFTAALALDGRNAIAYHQRGKAAAQVGDSDSALADFSAALRLDPHSAWAYQDRAEVWVSRNDFARAIADCSEALRLNPRAALAYLRRGEAHAGLREFERAIADFGNVLLLDPHNAAARHCRGSALRKCGQLVQAIDDLTRALTLDPTNPRLHLDRGLAFQRQGDHARALLDMSVALELDDGCSEAYFHRAASHAALRDKENAIADLSRCVRRNVGHAAAYNARGVLHAARGEADLAIADFGLALDADPHLTEACINRARALSKSGRLAEALADCDAAVALAPDLTTAHVIRGSVLAQQGDFSAAVQEFSHALQLGPMGAHVYYLRGVAHQKLNAQQLALDDLTDAIRLNPRHARACAKRAAIRRAAGQHELALDDLAHAACVDRHFALAYCGLRGLMHAGAGKYERAAADYAVAVMLAPKNGAARAALNRAWKAYRTQSQGRRAPIPGGQRIPANIPGGVSDLSEPPAAKPQRAVRRQAAVKRLPADSTSPSATPSVKVQSPRRPIPAPMSVLLVGDETFEGPLARGGAAPTAADLTPIEYVADVPVGATAPTAAVQQPVESPAADEMNTVAFELTVDTETEAVTFEIIEQADDSPAPDKPPISAAEQRDKDEADRALREQMIRAYQRNQEVECRKAEEKEKAAAKRRATHKSRRSTDDDDDDDRSFPMWKKGVLTAASLFALWWTVPAALAFVGWTHPGRPATFPVTGTIVLEKGEVPAGKVLVRFFPESEGGPGLPAYASTRPDGTFRLTTFENEFGAVPGQYVVVISPRPFAPELAPLIANAYTSFETSPIKVVVKKDVPTELPPIKLRSR